MADRDIHHLHPDLQPLALKFLDECKADNLNVRIIQGWRDSAYQDQLKSSGVSRLSGSQSLHCFTIGGEPASRAFDFGVFEESGSYVTDGHDHRYALAGQIAESLNLVWGGRWRHSDPDHVQLKDS